MTARAGGEGDEPQAHEGEKPSGYCTTHCWHGWYRRSDDGALSFDRVCCHCGEEQRRWPHGEDVTHGRMLMP